jgi:2-oxoisovalerate dehydrogenase E2 component (dihydrolipoyl transacylase)
METREFKLPDLGEGLTEAEIVQWLVKEGDTIELNQPIVEVETEKALVEIPSPFAGTVEKIFGEVGASVAVGSTIIIVQTADDAPKTGRKEVLVGYGPEEGGGKRRKARKIGRREEGSTEETQGSNEAESAEDPASREEPEQPAARSLATPPVRKLARDLGIDIDSVNGTGKDGRVTREDVTAAAEGPKVPVVTEPAAPADEAEVVPLGAAQRLRAVPEQEEERIPVRAIRRSIAEKMVRSAFTIPHVTEWLEVDATELMKLRADLKAAPEAADISISPLPIIVKALLAALRKHPLVNSSYDNEANEIVIKHVFHVGIATDTERGLLVPVVKDADQLNIFELAREVARLATAARDGKIGPADLTGSTITITNVGSFGMESGTPIINFPEAAILAPGVIAKRPWVVEDQIVVRDVMTLALSFDHRVIDGAEAGRFLRYLGDLIEKPARLFGVL